MCLINFLKTGLKFRLPLPTITCVWAPAVSDIQICTKINVLYNNILENPAGVLLSLISVFTAGNEAAECLGVLNIMVYAML